MHEYGYQYDIDEEEDECNPTFAPDADDLKEMIMQELIEEYFGGISKEEIREILMDIYPGSF